MKTISFIVLASFAAFPIAAMSQDFMAGVAAADSGDNQAALREWLPLAEEGDLLSQLFVANVYDTGRGNVAEDDQETLK